MLQIQYDTERCTEGEIVTIKGVDNFDEFVKAEHKYLSGKFGIPVSDMNVQFWLVPFTSDTAVVTLDEGQEIKISFKIPKLLAKREVND